VRKILFAGLVTLAVSGCAHQFVPGTGMDASQLGPDSAKCRLFARGSQQGFSASASGSPKFVGAYMGGAMLGYAIGTAVQTAQNFDDCMLAQGYQIVPDKAATPQPVPAPQPVAVQAPPTPIPVMATQPVPSPQPVVAEPTYAEVNSLSWTLQRCATEQSNTCRVALHHGLTYLQAEQWLTVQASR
jgi:hypothetical protein